MVTGPEKIATSGLPLTAVASATASPPMSRTRPSSDPARASQAASDSTVTDLTIAEGTAALNDSTSGVGSGTAELIVSGAFARLPAAMRRIRWASGAPSDSRMVTGTGR